jgi:hypothetical protein
VDATTLGVIGFCIALALTPVYLLIVVKGVRSLGDIRDVLTGRPGARRPRRDADSRR